MGRTTRERQRLVPRRSRRARQAQPRICSRRRAGQSRSHGAGPCSPGSAALSLCPVSPGMRTTSDILADLGVKLRSTQPGIRRPSAPNARTDGRKSASRAYRSRSTARGFDSNATTPTAVGMGDVSMTINPQAVEWLQARAIDPETASRIGIYTAGRGPDGDPRPDPAGNILVFPYIEGGREVNAKYRTIGEKRFWQRKDARKTFFNADVLDDPALERGDHALVITEGELDPVRLPVHGLSARRRSAGPGRTGQPCRGPAYPQG